MRLTQLERDQRRETILHTAFVLFCRHGIEAVTLTEISKRANVGRSAIFRYFESKDNLVLEAFSTLWKVIVDRLRASVEAVRDYAELSGCEQIKRWLESFQDLYREQGDYVLFSYEAKLYLLRRHIRPDRVQWDAMMLPLRAPCIAALDKGKADGSITARDDSEDLFYAVWGAVRGYIAKIVIYGQLYGSDSPWEARYPILEKAVMRSLCSNWE